MRSLPPSLQICVAADPSRYEALLSGYVSQQDATKMDEVLAILRTQFEVVSASPPQPT